MNKKLKFLLAYLLIFALVTPYWSVRASALSNARDVMSTVKATVVANHEIYFVSATGAANNTNITLTFTGFTTTGVAFGDVDIAPGDSGNCATANFTEATVAASAAAATWGVANSSPTITLSAPTSGGGTLSAGNCIRIRIGTNASTGGAGTNQITNASVGLKVISVAGTFGDSGDISVYLITDDQVSISATVPQALSFSLSTTTIGFGSLSASAVRFASLNTLGTTTPSAAHTLAVSTNASNGYVLTVKGATLTYNSATIDAIGGSNTAIATGTEQFGVRFTASGGSGSVTAPYAASGYAYAANATTVSQVASHTGPSDTTTYSAIYMANISNITDAGSYTTALTYVATAQY